jgi:hypothetical protein
MIFAGISRAMIFSKIVMAISEARLRQATARHGYGGQAEARN